MKLLDKVIEDYKNGVYEYNNKSWNIVERLFDRNHITDENKSVIWNREWVADANEKMKQRMNNRESLKLSLEFKLTLDIINAIESDYKISIKQAEYIYNTVDMEMCSNNSSDYEFNKMINKLNNYCELYADLRKMEDNK